MPLYDYECPCCGFVEERFVRSKVSEYDPGVCPNGCLVTHEQKIEVDGRKAMLDTTFQVAEGVKLEQKFNAGAMAKPIYRGYGWHNSDYTAHGPK